MNDLKEIGAPPYQNEQTWVDTVMVQRGLMQPYEMPGEKPLFSLLEIYKIFTFYSAYSVTDKLNALIGSKVSLQRLWMEVINANLFETQSTLNVSVYLFQGKYDQHTVTEVAKDYFDALSAPHKEYYLFDQSAHWPHIKEHQKYRALIETILVNQTNQKVLI